MVDPSHDELQQMALFGGLLTGSLQTLRAAAPVIAREPGDAFFVQGDDGDSLFVLLHGTAVAVLVAPNHSYLLRTISVGQSFGEAANIDLQPRRNSVFAQSACQAIEIGPDAMQALWEFDPEQFTVLSMNISRELSRRLRDSDRQRLAHWSMANGIQ